MQRQQLMRMAKLPCTGKVREGGKTLKCHDIYRVVTVREDGKILSIKCMTHGHKSKGEEKNLVRKIGR